MMKHGILLSLLISVSVSGFATQPPAKSALTTTTDAMDKEVENSARSCEYDNLGRRQFFVSIIGAASILAFDDASAEEVSNENLSTTSFSVATAAVEAAKPVVDTRAIFDKAAKKVRHELHLYSFAICLLREYIVYRRGLSILIRHLGVAKPGHLQQSFKYVRSCGYGHQ